VTYLFIALIAISLSLGSVASCEHRKVQTLTTEIAANKLEAKRIFDAETAKNAEISRQWAEYARKADDDYTKTIADIRARGNSARGVRLYDAGCGQSGSGSPAGDKGAGDTKDAAPTGQLSDRTTQFLVAQATRADEVHAYAVTCFNYVKPSIRESVRGK
jgi:hypothetical protein